ncbi:MAG: hypothetical protein FD165_1537 [Gammaproteobacteria bacterium]|nr:MAG: hypothetical protein FD165_1537 [Gammaproteobacteria bacterium]TND02452.1 MAG: hypothetical protein FD120_2193 [Gammaproteobacteria bacterium]
MIFERRQYPRTETEVPATITLDGGARFSAVVCSLSCAGLQLAVDRQTAAAIVPGSVLGTPLETLQLGVEFRLASPDGSTADVRVRGKVLGATRRAENVYRISLQYLDIDTAMFERIDRFVNAVLALA